MKTSISKKRILITGANGTLAKETIQALIKDGATDIVMACRTEAKGITAKNEILTAIGSDPKVALTIASGFDMNAPESIKRATDQLKDEAPFDIVFLAAGFAVFTDDYQSVEWNGKRVEKTIFQNLVGSHITLKNLKKNNLLIDGARIVLAGGEGARGIKGLIEKPVFPSSQTFRDYVRPLQKADLVNHLDFESSFRDLLVFMSAN